MEFFFPDSQDQIDPGFDFENERKAVLHVRQRDDVYAHEALSGAPYDGILVSKAIVDGLAATAGKYSFAQRHRLYRLGVHEFFRLQTPSGLRLQAMGDCGAFSYINHEVPPYTVDEVIDFYDGCDFDLGISIDHVVLGYVGAQTPDGDSRVQQAWRARRELTLDLAASFLSRLSARRCRLTPLGAAQGWSPKSYADSVAGLQQIGFRRIAVGGMVPLKTNEILACLEAIDAVRRSDTQLHLLGITRTDHLARFMKYGVTSFDSTSPFRQAFKDERDNYYTRDKTYTAIRIPQVQGNIRLRALILAGRVEQATAIRIESACRTALSQFDVGLVSAERVLELLAEYDGLLGVSSSRNHAYRELLYDQPWKSCRCEICREIGIEVAIFRGSERNKRRGFHNLQIFWERLKLQVAEATAQTRQIPKSLALESVH